MTRLGAIVLCGGRSSRMGRDKAWLPYGTETQLAAVCRAVASACGAVVVVAAAGQALPRLPIPVTVVIDREPYAGPLHGMAVGMDALPADCPGAFVSSCDVPGLTPAFVAAVCGRLDVGRASEEALASACLLTPPPRPSPRSGGREIDIAIPFAQGRAQPLSAAYRRCVAKTAWELLAADLRRPMFLLERHAHVVLPEAELRRADPELASLRHANTPAELAALGRGAGEPRGGS